MNSDSKDKSIILYDFLLVQGGAEAVTIDLCQGRKSLDMGVGFIDRSCFASDPIATDRLISLTSFTPIVGWQILKSALAFRFKSAWLKDYKRVIFSGASTVLAIKNRAKDDINLLYCHTPPRFVYDLKAHYLGEGSLLKRMLIKVLIAYLQPRYESAVARMDVIIANSVNVQKRIKRYLGLDAIVVYPPCHIERYQWLEAGDFYLSTARVEGYKRVDLIVKAFIKMPDKKLVVASGGSQLAGLQQLAKNAVNISFTGWCEQHKLVSLMGQCIATLYLPLDEDFGISPVESMAAGKPVIGVKEGGVMETVIDGKTGVLCPAQPQVEDVMAAVNQLTPQKALSLREGCEQQAAQFSVDKFNDKMNRILDAAPDQLADIARQVDAAKQMPQT